MDDKNRFFQSISSWFIWLFILLAGWQLFSIWIDNSLIFPGPTAVFEQLLLDLNSDFLANLMATFLRSFAAMVISVFLALVIAYLCFQRRMIRSLLEKSCLVLQTIPAIAYLILLLFWTNRETTIFFVIFFLVFPVSTFSFLHELDTITREKKSLLLFYPNDGWRTFRWLYMPILLPSVFSNLERGMILSLKSCVMAEILVSASIGIGMQIQSNRLFFNVAGVISWIIWLGILSFAGSFLIKTAGKFLLGRVL